ncbi:MAG: DNA-binding protein Alba [Candidatus Aenigmarchaeota archaeon]|nr:DNA-binding protein Alba [Candidatus Aenigmarchaeota archaeon]
MDQKEHKHIAPKERAGPNTIFIGKKPVMAYVLAAITQFSGEHKEVHIRARGRSISTAVDVAEVIRNKFVQNLTPTVSIGTEELTDTENRPMRVSTIQITLSK